MLKCHPITAFMKTHANFKKIFLIRDFWFKYIFPIKFKICILDLMLLPKTVFHLRGNTTVVCHQLCNSSFFFVARRIDIVEQYESTMRIWQ